MVFEKDGYVLHRREVTLKGGRHQTIFFFSKGQPRHGEPVDLPPGYHVEVNQRTGLPFLKKG